MRILPVVERELRAIARRPSAYWVRSASALAAFIAMAYVALIGAVGLPTGSQGRNLFEILSFAAFVYCAFAGTRGTSDALSLEKREGTLGLLFLTDLKGYDVVLGKLLSVSMNSIYGILAVAPPLALAFMLGGTSVLQFVLMIVFLLNTLFFSLAIGIFVSTFSQQERPAMGAALGIIFVILIMPYAIATAHTFGILEIWQVMEPGFLLSSPYFAYSTIKDPTLVRIYFDEVLLSLAIAHLIGWLCLVVASASITQRAHLEAPRGKFATWFANLREEWAYGKAERRRAIRGALLNKNAFAWLAGRDRLKQRYAWIFLALLGGLWALACWKAPEITEEWPFTLFSLWFLHLFFKVWVASEVAARFIEDRRSNALELLLTTPLKVRELARGQRLALFRQFGAPIAAIVILNFLASARRTDTSFLIRSPVPFTFFSAGLVHLACDLYAIHWVAIWRSLHLRGTNRTITQTIFLIVFLPTMAWFVLWQSSWILGRGGLSAEQLLWTWTYGCVIYDVVLAFIARRSFLRDFREVATQTFDKSTPFKWKFWKIARREPSPAPASGRKVFTRARKIAVAFAVILVCVNIGVSMRRHRLGRLVAARIAQARANGLPFTESEVARWRPRPAPDESAGAVIRRASKLYAASGRPNVAQLFDTNAHFDSREPLAPDVKAQIGVLVRSYQPDYFFPTLELLRRCKPGRVSREDRMRMGVMTDEITRILQMKARLEMEDDPEAAANTIALLLHFARCLQGESIPGFVGGPRALQAESQLMQRAAIQGNFSPEHWRAWKEILAQLEYVKNLHELLVVERADGFEMFSMPVGALYQRFGTQMGDIPALFNIGWSIRRYTGQDKAEMIEYLDYMNQSIADSTQPFWEIRKTRREYVWRPPTRMSSTFIAPQILPAFDWLFGVTTEMVARQRILMTVCDIEVYRRANNKLPDNLSELGAPLIDPFNGKSLQYIRRGADEYVVYAVGEDMTDNGGAPGSGHIVGDIAFYCGKAPERHRIIKKP